MEIDWERRVEEDYPNLKNGKEPGESWEEYHQLLRGTVLDDGYINPVGLVTLERYKLLEMYPEKYTTPIANYAAGRGQLDLLKRFAHRAVPTREGAIKAIKAGEFETFVWILEINPEAHPGQEGADAAAENGRVRFLDWLAIRPSQRAIDFAATWEKIETLDWGKKQNPPILPSQVGAECAATAGRTKTLDWLLKNSPDVLLHQQIITGACRFEHLEVLEWYKRNVPSVKPGQKEANLAASSGNFTTVQWIFRETGCLPDEEGLNEAAVYNEWKLLRWVRKQDPTRLPTEEAADLAEKNGYLGIAEWIREFRGKTTS